MHLMQVYKRGGECRMNRHVRPVICPPQCVVRDYYTTREVPVIHPIINVNRQHIVNVPRHIYQPVTRNVVMDNGYTSPSYTNPMRGMDNSHPNQSYTNPMHGMDNSHPNQGYTNPMRGGGCCKRCR